jgi:hypothetical protein
MAEELPGFIPRVLHRDDVSLLRADEAVLKAMVDGWRARQVAEVGDRTHGRCRSESLGEAEVHPHECAGYRLTNELRSISGRDDTRIKDHAHREAPPPAESAVADWCLTNAARRRQS